MSTESSLGLLFMVGIVACAPHPTPGPSIEAPPLATESPPEPEPTQSSFPDYLPSNLWGDLLILFEDAPGMPYDAKGEFETQAQYEERLRQRQALYDAEAAQYYPEKGRFVWEFLQEVDTLEEYDAENQRFPIDVLFSSAEESYTTGNQYTDLFRGPDFRLTLPEGVEETDHGKTSRWDPDDPHVGYYAWLRYYAQLPPDEARGIRECELAGDLYMRVYTQFEFPDAYRGWFYVRGWDFPEDYLRVAARALLEREFLEYNESPESIIGVNVVATELLCDDGNVLYRWD